MCVRDLLKLNFFVFITRLQKTENIICLRYWIIKIYEIPAIKRKAGISIWYMKQAKREPVLIGS